VLIVALATLAAFAVAMAVTMPVAVAVTMPVTAFAAATATFGVDNARCRNCGGQRRILGSYTRGFGAASAIGSN
jgi:hypothetical protein